MNYFLIIVVIFFYFLFKWIFRLIFISLILRIINNLKQGAEEKLNSFKNNMK